MDQVFKSFWFLKITWSSINKFLCSFDWLKYWSTSNFFKKAITLCSLHTIHSYILWYILITNPTSVALGIPNTRSLWWPLCRHPCWVLRAEGECLCLISFVGFSFSYKTLTPPEEVVQPSGHSVLLWHPSLGPELGGDFCNILECLDSAGGAWKAPCNSSTVDTCPEQFTARPSWSPWHTHPVPGPWALLGVLEAYRALLPRLKWHLHFEFQMMVFICLEKWLTLHWGPGNPVSWWKRLGGRKQCPWFSKFPETPTGLCFCALWVSNPVG